MAQSQPLSPPFSRQLALSTQLLKLPSEGASTQSPTTATQLDTEELIDHIPGEPGVDLGYTSVHDFLSSEFNTPVLDELYQHLWSVARRSGHSIDPLNRQRVNGRDILATDDPSLHLVWHRHRIYVKPMPLCLLNHDFWATYLASTAEKESTATSRRMSSSAEPMFDGRIALGFMRSYALLIRHHLDFVLAREAHLFPEDFDWIQWSKFITHFRHIEDDEVANRYHYGQLRLSRLNWAVRIFRPSSAQTKWFYTIPHFSVNEYLERATAPLIFGFATLSLVLSSMQVLLAISGAELDLLHANGLSLAAMKATFWVFSIMVLLFSGFIWALLFGIPTAGLIWQLEWGFKHREKKKVSERTSCSGGVSAKV